MQDPNQIWILVAEQYLHHYSERSFAAHFGIAVYILPGIYALYHQKNTSAPPRNHILFALYFLKTYPTEHVGASFCKCDEKTFRNVVRSTLTSLDHILPPVYHKIQCIRFYIEIDSLPDTILSSVLWTSRLFEYKYRR